MTESPDVRYCETTGKEMQPISYFRGYDRYTGKPQHEPRYSCPGGRWHLPHTEEDY